MYPGFRTQRLQVLKAIEKVSENPLSIYDGGYGKPLGNNKQQSRHQGGLLYSSGLSNCFYKRKREEGILWVFIF